MKKSIVTIISVILFSNFTVAQQNDISIVNMVNTIIQANELILPKTTLRLKADSATINNDLLKIYFNTKSSYSKAGLSAEYIEQLPEILEYITDKTGTNTILLFAKEFETNQWKTLDYFGNQLPTPKYVTPKKLDTNYPSIHGRDSNTNNKVFPGGTSSPNPTGPLAGKTVWLSPGHGWHNTGAGFVTQRGTTNEIVEDFTTAESIDNYLTYYLLNAGANVWSVRERDVNTNEIVIDNDLPASGYSETGTWANGSGAGYGGTYRVANADGTETATANYTATITQSGWYWVSVRCIAGTNRATDAQFTIIHSSDTSVVKVNQEIHSDTWIYVGQFYFSVDSVNKIILSNFSVETGQAIVADAVRFGGGIGATPDCLNTTGVSARPRFEESARQYAQFQKFPTCVEDVTVRPRYAEYELSKGSPTEIANAIFVAWHTNAGGGTGTETYSYNGLGSGQPNITAGSVELRNFIHNQLISDIQTAWKPTWVDRGVKTANFGELRPLVSIPGTLVELAFHDLAADATELKKPEFRRFAARSIYKGILKFFNNRDFVPLVFSPEQPVNIIAKNIGSNNVQLSWVAPVSGGVNGDDATGYKIYISRNGKSYKDGIAVTGNNYTFNGSPKTTYYFKITSTNAGGESFASSVVAVRTPRVGSTAIPYLIVDGFDRLDASALIPKVESVALGTVKRMQLEKMNRYDYMIEHANAIANCNDIAFDGCQNEAVVAGTILLAGYNCVDWIVGEESTVDKSIDVGERNLIKNYLNAGGNLFISGSEIGWDIGRAASANVDVDFYNNYLKATYIGDDAGTYAIDGTATLFTGQSAIFDNSTNGYYDVDFPDRIATNGGSVIALNYNAGTADAAAVAYDGAFKVIYLAFPFETITSTTLRNNLMCNAIAFLTPAVVVPIEGLEIEGKNRDRQNIISWATNTEIDTKYMIVERSTNAIMFNEISSHFISRGNVNIGAKYVFVDYSILQNGYYRIKVVDINGKLTFSKVILLKAQQTNNLFAVVNNPASNELKISIHAKGSVQINLTNAQGQLIYSNKLVATSGLLHTIDVSKYAKSFYQLSIINNDKQIQTEKFIIQR